MLFKRTHHMFQLFLRCTTAAASKSPCNGTCYFNGKNARPPSPLANARTYSIPNRYSQPTINVTCSAALYFVPNSGLVATRRSVRSLKRYISYLSLSILFVVLPVSYLLPSFHACCIETVQNLQPHTTTKYKWLSSARNKTLREEPFIGCTSQHIDRHTP